MHDWTAPLHYAAAAARRGRQFEGVDRPGSACKRPGHIWAHTVDVGCLVRAGRDSIVPPSQRCQLVSDDWTWAGMSALKFANAGGQTQKDCQHD